MGSVKKPTKAEQILALKHKLRDVEAQLLCSQIAALKADLTSWIPKQ